MSGWGLGPKQETSNESLFRRGRNKFRVPAPPKTAPICGSFSQWFPRLLRQLSRDRIKCLAIAPASPDQGLTARDSHLPAESEAAGIVGSRKGLPCPVPDA